MHFRDEPELVKKYFSFLLDEYGFKVFESKWYKEYNFWAVVFVSDKCRIKVIDDRGTVMLSIGPLWDPPGWNDGPWIDLAFVTSYLTKGTVTWRYTQMGDAEPQLPWLVDMLRPYLDQSIEIFSPDAFPKHRDELDRIWRGYIGGLLGGNRDKGKSTQE